MIDWVLREPTADDLPFIMSTWLKSARKQGARAFMTNTVYYRNEKRRIEELLDRAQVRLISNPADPDHLFGWACFEMVADIFVVHYVYVKRGYRGMGYAKQALERIFPAFGLEQIGVTDITGQVAEKREKYRLHFDPELARLSI
jgi:GNAT superfamily N-acetyltransferase